MFSHFVCSNTAQQKSDRIRAPIFPKIAKFFKFPFRGLNATPLKLYQYSPKGSRLGRMLIKSLGLTQNWFVYPWTPMFTLGSITKAEVRLKVKNQSLLRYNPWA